MSNNMVDVAIGGVMLAACSFYTANIQQCFMEGGFCGTLPPKGLSMFLALHSGAGTQHCEGAICRNRFRP
jgi:hypothetical protein